jgi:hypothetical protein
MKKNSHTRQPSTDGHPAGGNPVFHVQASQFGAAACDRRDAADKVLCHSMLFRNALSFQTRPPPAWIGCALGAGVILSLAVFFMLRAWERRDLEKRASSLTRDQVERVQADMLRSMEVLHSISSLYSARGKVDRGEFHEFVQNALADQIQPLAGVGPNLAWPRRNP